MAGIFDYNPAVSDNRAAIAMSVAPAIRQDFATVGAAITQAEQNHKQLKAKKALADIYAGQLGVDSEQVDKLPVAKLDAFLMTAPGMVEERKQRQQSAVIGSALAQILRGMQPQTNVSMPPMGSTYATAFGAPGSMLSTTQPNRVQALLSGLSAAGAAGADPKTMSVLANLAKTFGGMMNSGFSTDPSTGLALFNGKLPPIGYQNFLGGGGSGAGPQFSTDPRGNEFMQFGGKVTQVKPPASARPGSAGDIPPDATLRQAKDEDGKAIPGVYQIMQNGKATGYFQGQQEHTGGLWNPNDPNGGGQPNFPPPQPKQPEGRIIKDINGKPWLYTGSMAEPGDDKDESHWQQFGWK